MKFSYSTGNLIFFGVLIILLILPIFDRHKIGKFQTQKSLLGIRLWAITYLPIERARCLPQINAIKFLGNPEGKIFERQTKATLEVKTRHFVTTFEGQKQRYSRLTRYLCVFFAWNSFHLPRQFVSKQLYAMFCAFCWEPFANKWHFVSCNICTLRKLSRSKAHWNVIAVTWNCNFLNTLPRNPIYKPTIF